jgi:short-subunit dehydrogenase
MVNGATGAVGQVVARAVAETGARLVLTARRPEALDALAADLALDAGCALYHAADLADEAQVAALMATVASAGAAWTCC